MSKTDDMRAMREARYAASRARATTPAAAPAPPTTAKAPTSPTARQRRTPATPAAPVTPVTPVTAEELPAPVAVAEAAADPSPAGLCGHRAISGRTCTREAGHAVKSHRYS